MIMADSADLVCLDCHVDLPLGWFWNTAEPRYLFEDGVPSSHSTELTRALWKMLAEHVYHDLRVLGEQSTEWEDLDLDRLRTIGGELQGLDPTLEEFLGDWPG
jgi:hypothetical protein